MSQQDGEPPRTDLVTGVTTLEKVAQGGRGLQTVGLDLGILGNRNNVDDEIRRHGSSSSSLSSGGAASSSSSSQRTQFSSGSRTGSTGYGQLDLSQSNTNDNDDDQYEDEEEIYDESYDNNDQQSHSSGTGHKSQSSYSYSYTSKSDPQSQHYRRTRDVNSFDKNKPLCQTAQCVNLRCVVGPLDKNTGALIALRTRLVAHTLNKVRKKPLNFYPQLKLILVLYRLEANVKSDCQQWQLEISQNFLMLEHQQMKFLKLMKSL